MQLARREPAAREADGQHGARGGRRGQREALPDLPAANRRLCAHELLGAGRTRQVRSRRLAGRTAAAARAGASVASCWQSVCHGWSSSTLPPTVLFHAAPDGPLPRCPRRSSSTLPPTAISLATAPLTTVVATARSHKPPTCEALPTPPQPVAVISAPTIVSVCNDIQLNGLRSSGGGIYPLAYNWTVSVHPFSGVSAAASLCAAHGSRTR